MTFVAVVIALLLVIVGVRSVTVVPEGHAYVVERIGRYHRTLTAGRHVRLPFLDRVAFRYSLRPRAGDVSDVCVSFDNVPVRIESTYRWEIVDAQQAAYGAADVMELVREAIRSRQREWIGRHAWTDIRETTRQIESDVVRAAAEAAALAGVRITDLTIQRVDRAAS